MPETAIVASAVLPGSLGLFCHAPPAAPGAPPFVYVPVLGATRLPNMLGYAQAEPGASRSGGRDCTVSLTLVPPRAG